MADAALPEHYHLLAIFHHPLLIHIHAVCQYLVLEVFLHLGDIDDVPLGKFLKLLVVDIRTVQCNDLVMSEMAGCKHEGITGSGGGELHVTMNTLVCMNDGMHFYAPFLLSRFRMPTHAFEYDVREQCYSRGIDDSQPFYPFLSTVTSAVRRKYVLIGVIKVMVYILKELLRPSGIGIGKSVSNKNKGNKKG